MAGHTQTYHFINAATSDLATILSMNSLLCKSKEHQTTSSIELYQNALNASQTSFSAQMDLIHRTYHHISPSQYSSFSFGAAYENMLDAVSALEEAGRLMAQLDAAMHFADLRKRKWRDTELIGWGECAQLTRLQEILAQLIHLRDEFLRRARGTTGWKGYWEMYTRSWVKH